jgi:hypothetical protein
VSYQSEATGQGLHDRMENESRRYRHSNHAHTRQTVAREDRHDFRGLKAEITKLPKWSKVSYIFSDFRPDLLTHKQIIELRDLCKQNEMVFHLHKGG